MKLITLLLTLTLTAPAWAGTAKSKKTAKASKPVVSKNIDIESNFDNLGSNEGIIEKAQALQPENTMRIVQKREVDRNWRIEAGGSYGMQNGGDSYVESHNWGGNLDVHITPRWSLGFRYLDTKNKLTAEGQRIFDDAAAKQAAGDPTARRPDIDFPLQTYLAVINWYPIYGKISWFESAVSQFDFYLLAGGGTVKTDQGSSGAITGGVGMGLWWNSWLTSRIEVRYQNYKDRVYSGDRNIDAFIGSVGIGFML